MWAVTNFYQPEEWEDLDYSLGFLMDNYEIIVPGGCLKRPNEGRFDHEGLFQELVERMWAVRPNSTAKVYYYIPSFYAAWCNEATDKLVARPDLWLRDSTGSPFIRGPSHLKERNRPMYDFRLPEARELFVNAALDPVKRAGGRVEGIYLDGLRRSELTKGHRFPFCGEDGESNCIFSEMEEEEFQEGRGKAVELLRQKLHSLNSEYSLIGNGISNHDLNSPRAVMKGNPSLDFYLDKVDGFCMEHVMAFEDVADESPYINIDYLKNLIRIRNILVAKGKSLLVKLWPGPVSRNDRLVGNNLIFVPNKSFPHPEPQTNQEVQQSMKDLLDFPLAVYMCAFHGPNITFSYSYFYHLRQMVPCRQDYVSCHFPQDFHQLLDKIPGESIGEATWEGNTCTRMFENFGVSVNIEDETSATWLQN